MQELQIDKFEVEKFIQDCKRTFSQNLISVVLFGSRYWGFANNKSDYDLFVFVKNIDNAAQEKQQSLQKKYPKFHIRYFLSVNDENLKKRSGWASYVVLTKFCYPLYQTDKYLVFLNALRSNTPDISEVTKEYKSQKNKYELEELEKKEGFKAIEWAFFSIWKRLQIISFYAGGEVVTDLDKNISLCRDILSEEEVQDIYNFRKKTFERSQEWNPTDHAHALQILNRLNEYIENIPDASI